MAKRSAFNLCVGATALAGAIWASEVQAQPTSSPSQSAAEEQAAQTKNAISDIIVTARKRDETSLSVPVQIAAVGAAEIQRRGITRLDDLNAVIPQLQFGESSGSVQGGTVTLRGTGAGDGSVFIDQAVSFVIDGAPVARASVRRMSELDTAQIEILKGPQALFFGKNSPAGIITIRTADPGNRFEAGLRSSYEFRADEIRMDGFLSTPLTDSLGLRLAAYGSRISGDKIETISPSSPFAPSHRGVPFDREYGGRVTLKFQPSDKFDARFKLNYGKTKTAGLTENAQFTFCPTGSQQFGDPGIPCKAGRLVYSPQNPSNLSGIDYRFGDGSLFLNQTQILSSLEVNYQISDAFKITSVTGYYDVKINYANNSNRSAIRFLPAVADTSIKDFSQELRLTSALEGPLNFVLGGFYGTTDGSALSTALTVTPTTTTLIGRLRGHVDGSAYSAFGQLSWDIAPTVELAGGGRYSHETKNVEFFTGRNPGIYDIPSPTPVRKRTFNNFSPEATLAWRPTREFTLFGAYKRGFLSGGFNTAIGSTANDRSYAPQKVKGFEVGAKASLFGGTVRANVGIYDYVTDGLQLTIVFVDNNGNNVAQVLNVGKSTSKGIESDVTWRTPLEGLTLRGAFGYNHARYNRFNTTCYRGQTISLGCNVAPNASGSFTLQDLGGRQLVRAPDWAVNGGADFDTPIGSSLKFGISADAAYSGGYFTTVQNIPNSRQDGYWIINASARIAAASGRWELALLGKNLSNTYYITRSAEGSGQGTVPGTATGMLADLVSAVSRGRQIVVRATLRY